MHLPHVAAFAKSPIYFLTICTHERRKILANEPAFSCLRRIFAESLRMQGWSVGRFVVMPDHVHLFARPAADAVPRGAWLKAVKSISARRIGAALGMMPPIWQRDTFDHVLRSAESYSEKWAYVRQNPVRHALVAQVDAWPWQGEIFDLSF